MRLICPSCRAQYEVDDDAIPAEGRDVQCGSCSTTWFQEHALTLAGAVPAPLSESTKPVFRHQGTPGSGIPAPQPMPDDSSADREKLLREIRAEAAQELSQDANARIEREPLATNESNVPNPAFEAPQNEPAAIAENRSQLNVETALDTGDVHAYPAISSNDRSAIAKVESGRAEEAFMQNLRSQIEEQYKQPDNFSTTRSSSVISAAEKAGISLDPARTAQQNASSRAESVQRTIRDITSTPEESPRRRSYSVGVYSAAALFLLAFAAYLLRDEITRYYPAAQPWLDSYANVIDALRRLIQDLWNYARDWVIGMIGSTPPTT